MLEGLVQNLLFGYLGSYFKNIQKEQLKFGLWDGKLLLQNLELNLEAFDNLQSQFSLKQGRVESLSITVPWKKLGWEPIIISLENVFLHVCQRDEDEWSSDSVERREYAGKKAKLHAAEIAKLTRAETKTGKSFISHITAKILDGIQLSIRNFHFIYSSNQSDTAQFVFGLQFSSWTMERNVIGSSSAKLVDIEVNKSVRISDLGIYCNTSEGTIDNIPDSEFFCSAKSNTNKFNILVPCDVTVSFLVNRSGHLEDGVPQYSISVNLTTLDLRLNEIQMQQILILCDYLGTCHLREKYGRFRPYCGTLYDKIEGWQKMWWHYAQESILSDVRRRLRKTSWRYLGWRISYRRTYVSLYKKKLNFIRQSQHVDNDILRELEQMEKESDIDDILTYRSIAEFESQEFLLSSTLPNMGKDSCSVAAGGKQMDEGSSAGARGWINWLSLGMLGAGGAEDSIQFSGVVSDEIVKDIYEVTQFHPMPSLEGGALTKAGIFLSSIKFNAHQIKASLLSKTYDKEVINMIFDEVNVVFKLWEESWNVLMLINLVEVDDLCMKKVIPFKNKGSTKENYFITFEVDMSMVNSEPELSLKAVFEPFEVTYKSEFLLNLRDFYLVLESFQFHSERVLSSLSGFENDDVRLLSKAAYIFSNRKKVKWDACFSTIIIKVPWGHEISESFMGVQHVTPLSQDVLKVMEFGSLFFRSKNKAASLVSVTRDQCARCPTPFTDAPLGIQFEDLYDHFEIVLTSCKVNAMPSDSREVISIVDGCNASLTFACCIIPDKSVLKQLEVQLSVPSLCVHFSASIYGALLGTYARLDIPKYKLEKQLEGARSSDASLFCISAGLKSVSLYLNAADDAGNCLSLNLEALGEVDMLCASQEVLESLVRIKTIKISSCTSSGESSGDTLCKELCSKHPRNYAHHSNVDVSSDGCEENASDDACLILHYQAQRSTSKCCPEYSIHAYDLDLHVYPKVVGLFLKVSDELSGYDTTSSAHSCKSSPVSSNRLEDEVMKYYFESQKFGCPNFSDDGCTELQEGIPLDHFPFVKILNSDSLRSLNMSLTNGFPKKMRYFSESYRSSKHFRKRSRMLTALNLVPLSQIGLGLEPEVSSDVDLHVIDLCLNSIRLHFHDTSDVLATVTVPHCKSFIVQGTRSLEMLFSIQGLLLSSKWATQDFGDSLWGYLPPNLSNILNIRMRKNYCDTLNQNLEISFSAQDVCCILPSEFLAILIGYFSLRDWSPCVNEGSVTDDHRQSDTDNCEITWKVEILNSTLVLPVECGKGQCLHLGLQQLYFRFSTTKDKQDALKDIPFDCMVPAQKVVDNVHILNVFGRSVSLSFVILKDDEVCVKLDQDTGNKNVLILPCDFDLWIRLPCDNAPFDGIAASTCIMSKLDNCVVIVEDHFFFRGAEAVLNVVDEFSAISQEAECFKSNIHQFLQLKKILRESSYASPDGSCVVFTEVRCCVSSLSINLCRSRIRETISSELVARADMQAQFSVSFRDNVPLCLDAVFSTLALRSLHSCMMLVQCTSDASDSSGLGVQFAKSHQDANELHVNLPSVHVYLDFPDWCDVIALLVSYSEKLARTSFMNTSLSNSNSSPELARNEMKLAFKSEPDDPRLSSSLFCTNMEDSFDLIVKSENLGISLYYPLPASKEVFIESREAEVNLEKPWGFSSDKLGKAAILKGRDKQYVSLIMHSKACEVSVSERHTKLNCCVEEARGSLDVNKNETILSWSMFELFQVNVLAVSNNKQNQHICADIEVEKFDMSVSHPVFYVWHSLGLRNPATESSQYSSIRMDLKVQLRKASLVLTDGTCSCNGPILEVTLRNLILHSDTIESAMEVSLGSDLLVNYFNVQKVTWEPFIETWSFLLSMARTHKQRSPLNTSMVIDIHMTSTSQLNLNITETIIEVIFRVKELIEKVWGQVQLNDLLRTQRFLSNQATHSIHTRRYAPYVLQNETSLPLVFQVYHGQAYDDDLEVLSSEEGNIVYPGSSVPIYTETPEEQVFRFRPPQSSDRLNKKNSLEVAHHMISVQLDGTTGPSLPISMDSVGLSYFEVNFSKAIEKEAIEKIGDTRDLKRKIDEKAKVDPNNGFVVPVVFDVSTLHYRKLIRVYSTVILLNTTSRALELRFDTPFGVSPKVLDQINPGEEFPLPLHLAEAGRMRWRPLGSSFLWSEAYMFSKVVSQETKLGSFRSFVCYPSHPSSEPFRCCLVIQLISLDSTKGRRNGLSKHTKETLSHSVGANDQSLYNRQNSKTPYIHYVTLTTPLLVRNYMPREVSLTIESGGVARTELIKEVGCASFFHVDSSHDLDLVFHVHGFRPSISRFPRAEAFAAVARFHENKFSQSETLTFYPDSSIGTIYVTVEKVMDAYCGARELSIFVPFLLYNCTGLQITVADLGHEVEGCSMPPCYDLIKMDQHLERKKSAILLSSNRDSHATASNIDNIWNLSSMRRSISLTNTDHPYGNRDYNHLGDSLRNLNQQDTRSPSQFSEKVECESDRVDLESKKVKACMYCPHSGSSASELLVRLSICMPKRFSDNKKSSVWSSPFYLVPASGSTCVVVPQTNTSGAFIVSVTSSPLAGPFSGRTRAITFQHRFIISNACSKDLCYKQKGTDSVFHLGVGQHSHLHWADPSRELLVSLVFSEPGWLWSGSFFPDHLGDTQVKMRNYVRGTMSMIRVEIQNADVTVRDEKIVGSPNGNSGTLLILLSDDDTGFMPYRIDNFSRERLRIFQEDCKTFETTVHSYMSCPYTWDEPCYPHHLVVEVLGERVLGSYTLDDVTELTPIYLPSTSEKPGRQLFLSIHADGAVKVLSIMDSNYLHKNKESSFSDIKEKRALDLNEDIFVDYCERISVQVPFIGVSVINSYPQELLFASANDTRIDLLQNVEQQKVSIQISSLQVDNQLHNTPYPVILSLDHDYRGSAAGQLKNKDDNARLKNETVLDIASEKSCQPIFCLSALKWRNSEISLVFFEYINLRLAPLRLELEEEVILCLFDFVKSVISRTQSRDFPCSDLALYPLATEIGSVKRFSVEASQYESLNVNRRRLLPMAISTCVENWRNNPSLPTVVPIEDFWRHIYLLARKQNKIYVEVFDLAPIKLTLSFSSAPWMPRNGNPTSAKNLRPISSTAFQRGLMVLADVEGATVKLKQLNISHHMGTSETFHEILLRHYTPELLHEMYKVFGSASVIGNPMGFAKNLGLGIKGFLTVPTTRSLKSPSGLFTGVAHSITSLCNSTVYATSNAATQFSKSVHKTIVAFTLDDQAVSTMEKQWSGLTSQSKGVLNEFLEGLTGFLQSPIRGAEEHGLPGFLSGVARGTAGVITRPIASILEVTGKTAQSIRNRSRLHRSDRYRARFPRPLNSKFPLRPYSWEEAIGISILLHNTNLKYETFLTCKSLKPSGTFLVVTERLVLVVSSSLIGFGTPEFRGVADPEWVVEFKMGLKDVIHVGRVVEQVNIVGINSELPKGKIGIRTKRRGQNRVVPVFKVVSVELEGEEEAESVVEVLVATIDDQMEQGAGVLVLHRSNLKGNRFV